MQLTLSVPEGIEITVKTSEFMPAGYVVLMNEAALNDAMLRRDIEAAANHITILRVGEEIGDENLGAQSAAVVSAEGDTDQSEGDPERAADPES